MPEVALGSKVMVVAATGVPGHGRKNPSLISRTPEGATRLKDKKSLDYVLRSGLAGGIAGCAVRLSLFSSGIAMLIEQNRRRH